MLRRFFNLHTYLGTVLVIAYRRNTKPLNFRTKLARKKTLLFYSTRGRCTLSTGKRDWTERLIYPLLCCLTANDAVVASARMSSEQLVGITLIQKLATNKSSDWISNVKG